MNTNLIKNADFLYNKMRNFFNTQMIISGIEMNIFNMLNNDPLTLEQMMDNIGTKNKKIEFLLFGLKYFKLCDNSNGVWKITDTGKLLLDGTDLCNFIKGITSASNNGNDTLYDKWSSYHKTLNTLYLEYNCSNKEEQDLYNVIMGFTDVQVLYAAIRLGIIECLDNNLTVQQIAHNKKLDQQNLNKLFAMLENLQIIENNDSIKLLNKGKMLLKDHPFSLYYICDFMANETYKTWRYINHYFIHNEPSFFLSHNNLRITDYMKKNKGRSEVFGKFLGERMMWLNDLLLSYSFKGKIIDLGGADGKWLRLIVDNKKNEIERVSLLELPEILDNVKKTEDVHKENISRNIEYIPKSFFEELPKDYDIYFMARVVQDWNDEKMIQILRNIYSAMNSKSKLVILDYCYSNPLTKYDINAVLDLACISPEGTMRSETEIKKLFELGGFKIENTITNKDSDYKPSIFILTKL